MYSKKKNSQLHIKIATCDKNKIKDRAKLCNMSVQSYCEYVLLHTKVKVVVEE